MMSAEPDDDELARRARDGDREALAELVRRERPRLLALAYTELRDYDDAQDAVASALLRICLHVGELRQPERVRAWMQAIVRNEARRQRRRPPPEAAALSLEAIPDEPFPRFADRAAAPDLTILRLDLLRALRQLPWDEARALALFYLARLSISEIARHLGRPEGTIKSWLHRGRQHLAAELVDYSPRRPVS